MTTRSEFISRVRSGLGKAGASNSAKAAPLACDTELVRLAHPGNDLASLFAFRAAAAGMTIHRCKLTTLAQTVQGLLGSLGTKHVVLDHLDSALARPAADALAALGAQVIDPLQARSLEPHFDVGAGLTGVLAAIAETGTLVLTTDASHSRGAFIIPPVHVAFVHESQIIPDMLDLWPRIGHKPPTALTLITGPSKTADIEGILVTGVHGPGAVHVILIASEPTDPLLLSAAQGVPT